MSSPPAKSSFRVLFLIVLADMIGFGIILPILPVYAREFGAATWQITLLFSVYSLCQFVAAPVLGAWSDRIGRRPILIFSQIGSGVASLTLAYATWQLFGHPAGLFVVYAARIVDGISGGNLSAAQAYVSDTVPPEHRAKYMGLLGAAFGTGFALGPAIGGLLGHFNPALAPLASAAFSLTAAVLSYRLLPESLAAPIVHTDGHFTRSLALMRNPILAQINGIWFISMFAFVSAEVVFALFMADTFGFSTWQIGLMFTLAGVVIIGVQGRAIGPLSRRWGEWNVATLGPLIFTAAMALFVLTNAHTALSLLVAATVFNAVGRSLQTPVLSTLISRHAPAGQQGAAFGLFQGFGSLARVGGPATAGWLYDQGHAWPYVMAGGLTLVAGLWTLTLRPRATETAVAVPNA